MHAPPSAAVVLPVLSSARAPCRREYVAKILMGSVPDLKQADAYVIMQKAHKCGGQRQKRWHGLGRASEAAPTRRPNEGRVRLAGD